MTSLARIFAFAVTCALSLPAEPARAEAPTCTGTLSGAVEGTFKCGLVVRDLGDGTAVLEFRLLEKPDTVDAFFPGNWIIPGEPAVRAYPFSDLGQGRTSLIVVKSGTLYSAQRSSTDRGDVTVVLSTVKASAAKPRTWEVHGSLRATTLSAASFRKDQVIVEARF